MTAAKVETAIRDSFERSALLDAKKIEVETSGSKVTLTGKVRNHAEREEAERVAWAAPGVYSVDNELTVEWSWFGE
ncbi:MAG: BON domain-containing protein [Chthoniobacter sp.]|uniref:BON domain-containing protein n=1 Tax=Chthoniobacter sp. TaxID=2510640 RepID=UPI0032AA93C2